MLACCPTRCESLKLAADEKGVSSENDLLVAILKQEANAVLGVARGVQSLDFDVTNVEGFAVCRCLGHFFAVSSTDDGEGEGFQLVDGQSYSFSSEDEKLSTHHLNVTAGMIVVAMVVSCFLGMADKILCSLVSVDDVDEVDSSAVHLLLEHRKHPFRSCQFPRIAVTETATHSEGFAGSMITASLDLSSTTR
jgi:hypothetical protein